MVCETTFLEEDATITRMCKEGNKGRFWEVVQTAKTAIPAIASALTVPHCAHGYTTSNRTRTSAFLSAVLRTASSGALMNESSH